MNKPKKNLTKKQEERQKQQKKVSLNNLKKAREKWISLSKEERSKRRLGNV